MTKISEVDALARAGQKIEVIEWAPEPIAAIPAAAASEPADSEQADEEADEEADDDSNIPY